MLLFEVVLAPGSLGQNPLTEETLADTMAQVSPDVSGYDVHEIGALWRCS